MGLQCEVAPGTSTSGKTESTTTNRDEPMEKNTSDDEEGTDTMLVVVAAVGALAAVALAGIGFASRRKPGTEMLDFEKSPIESVMTDGASYSLSTMSPMTDSIDLGASEDQLTPKDSISVF